LGYILRIGFRHLETIRCQTIGCVSALHASRFRFSLADWIHEEVPELESGLRRTGFPSDSYLSHVKDEQANYAISLNGIIRYYERSSQDLEVKAFAAETLISTSASHHIIEDDAGTDLGGGWDLDPFPVRAGVILTLGALEGFERGTIRILTGARSRRLTKTKTASFQPKLKHFLKSNPEWEELERRRKTFTPWARKEILTGFGITWPDQPWRQRLDATWKSRNRLVHGYEAVEITFSDFLRTQYDSFSAMRHLAAACLRLHDIDL
jgi:hypothetical protein